MRWASGAVGGPPGRHAAAHRRLTPAVVVLSVLTATFTLGLVLQTPCAAGDWWQAKRAYADLCWSRLPHDYAERGLAERTPPLSDGEGRFRPLGDSPPVAVAGYGAALGAAALSGWPDVGDRAARPRRAIAERADVRAEAVAYTGVVSVVLLLAALGTAGLLTRVHSSRPWDATGFVAAPALALTAVMGWDLLGVASAVACVWAWSRGRAVAAGVLAGLGAATAGWPALVAGALLLLCVRERRLRLAGQVLGSGLATFAAVLLPAYLITPAGTSRWWQSGPPFGAGAGSTWQLPELLGRAMPAPGWVELLAVAGVVAGVAFLTLSAPRRPRVPQVALLLVVGFLLVHRAHGPATVLWLLPLAALARPRWRDLLLWQLGEVAFVLALAWHRLDYTVPDSGRPDLVLVVAVLARIAGELWLAAVVVRDIWRPWYDPVRAGGWVDDPAGGPLADEAPAAVTR